MIICDGLVQKKFNTKQTRVSQTQKQSLLKTGIIVSIGLALHNLPEGLAIGSGFGASLTLGYSLAIAICLHDIPERNINGSSYEKWRNEPFKSYFLCCAFRNYHWNRGFLWRLSRWDITKRNCYLFKLCRWCNVIYCIRRIDTRIKQIIPWKNDCHGKYTRFLIRNDCHVLILKITYLKYDQIVQEKLDTKEHNNDALHVLFQQLLHKVE